MKNFGFLVLFMLIAGVNAFSQGRWTYISEADGQSIGYVSCMARGKDGTIWVGSFNGLFRYKDNKWNYEPSMQSNFNNMEVSQNGDLWICTYPDSLVKYDGENWFYYHLDGAFRTNDIDIDDNGFVWCATYNGVYKFDGSNWINYSIEDGLKSTAVTWISISPSNEPWIRYGDPGATDNNRGYGLSKFNGIRWETFDTSTGLPRNEIFAIVFGPDGYTYASFSRTYDPPCGILRYDGSEWIQISDKYTGKSLEFDKDGKLWVLYSWPIPIQVVNYQNSTWSFFTDVIIPSELTGITGEMLVDDNGNIWLGGYQGVLIYFLNTSVNADNNSKPVNYSFFNNYPNPFNLSTTISYILHEPSYIKLVIYNSIGQEVMKIADGYENSGFKNHVVNFSDLNSGQYFANLIVNGKETTRKLMLLK